MSIFSEVSVQLNIDVHQIAIANQAINPTLAVLTIDKIILFDETGQKLDYELSRNVVKPTCLVWHPFQPILAIGWQNGNVTLWIEDQRKYKEEVSVHKDSVNNITYNQTGTRMVTCDESGMVAVWRGISCIAVYKREGSITHCVFCEVNLDNKSQNNLFFFGGKTGLVCLADDQNHISEVCKVGGSIKSLVFYQKENSVIIITTTLLLVQFKISMSDKQAPDRKVKLAISGDPDKLQSIFIGSCLLCTMSVENMIRFWQLEQDENYVLTLMDTNMTTKEKNKASRDKFTQVMYDKKGKNLVAGTQEGKLVFWKNMSMDTQSPTDNDQWKPLPHLDFQGQIKGLTVGADNGIIGLSHDKNISLVTETLIKGKSSKNFKILQISKNEVKIHVENDIVNEQIYISTDMNNIKGLDCNDQYIVVHTNKDIQIHEVITSLNKAQNKQVASIEKKSLAVGIHNESIFMFNDYQMDLANFKGVVKQQEKFAESEGKFKGYQAIEKYLVIIFDKSRREFRAIGQSRKFENSQGSLGNIRSCTLLEDGKKIVICAESNRYKNRFYIYDLEVDQFIPHELNDITPLDSYADIRDKRFFCVYCTKQVENKPQNTILTFFFTSENGVKQQDAYQIDDNIEGIFSLSLPYLNLIERVGEDEEDQNNSTDKLANYNVKSQLLNDFIGLEKIDEEIKAAIMNFSFFLSINNLDEAYKSVKSIQNPSVWEKMAQMCVRTKRLDVAEICIGNMRFARGARAIRESKQHKELEAQLAMVAIQLNMKQEAVKLYEECGRHDLINLMYQAEGRLDESIKIAEEKDRINLKNTYYRQAKDYEVLKDFNKAIEYYELSETHQKEVPRMLIENQEINLLEDYISSKRDQKLFKFWGQYLESIKNYQECLQYYQKANDYASIVRILCFKQQYDKAKNVCLESQSPQAFFYLAKQLEVIGQLGEAIQYYAKSQQYSQAIKIAIENGMSTDVYNLAMQGTQKVKAQGGKYFEEKAIDKSIFLYRKGQHYQKALILAQKHNMRQEAVEIQKELTQYQQKLQQQSALDLTRGQTDNVEIYIQRGQYEMAIPFLMQNKDYDRVLGLAQEYNVKLTEDVIRKMMPEDRTMKSSQEKLQKLAEVLKKQGSFRLASELYIMTGDKVKGIKCMISQGDVQKVITLAVNARMPEIYILAANFLQNSDWHQNSNYMQYIIQFYSKAKAYDNLAQFFDACSQVEIHDYKDYNKALQALNESKKAASKSSSSEKNSRIQQIENKMTLIQKYLQTKQLQGQESIDALTSLASNPAAQSTLRIGDLYANLVELYYKQNQFTQAYEFVQKMQQKNLTLQQYIDLNLINSLKKQLQIDEDDAVEEDIGGY